MFKSALLLLFVLAIPSGYSQVMQVRRDEPNGSADAVHVTQEDKQRRRDELRAALKSQSDEVTAGPVKAISARERAALREQLRIHGSNQQGVQP
jgi:hypothetical protein